ncbi:MAG: hypothetical protein C4558_02540 [Dehalococcoidia bacterium]|nr:MAG: hypothetical protein C4558_02540 [Dehalococcoidia bacterium]
MPLLRFGLNAGAAVVVIASTASWMAGYTVEVALLRGLLAFPLVAFAAFFAELVVSTASPAETATGRAAAGDPSDGGQPVDLTQAHADRNTSADRQAAQA